MRSIKSIRLGIGFIALAGAPPFLVYDFHQIADGQVSLFNWFTLILCGLIFGALAFMLLSSRGENYAHLKFLWEWPLAFVLFVLSLPLLALTALLIRLESPGSAVYMQQRIGKNFRRKDRRRPPVGDEPPAAGDHRGGDRRQRDIGGRSFTIYKLRSMVASAERETGAAWSTGESDPRVTRVGRFIRRTHIDELPQLFNVLLGQMSIIGPRPERPDFVAELTNVIADYRKRLDVTPGITGLAQVKQQYDGSLEDVREKLVYDVKYIQGSRFLLDARIIFETFVLIVNLFLDSLKKKRIEKVEPKTLDVLAMKTVRARSR